jgi:hypothetical protein
VAIVILANVGLNLLTMCLNICGKGQRGIRNGRTTRIRTTRAKPVNDNELRRW